MATSKVVQRSSTIAITGTRVFPTNHHRIPSHAVHRLFLHSDETIVSVVDRHGISDRYSTVASGQFSEVPLVSFSPSEGSGLLLIDVIFGERIAYSVLSYILEM